MGGEKKKQGERDETDKSLKAERVKTDEELRKVQGSLHSDAKASVASARAETDSAIRESRRREDASEGAPAAGSDAHQTIAKDRRRDDAAVANERATLDATTDRERLQRELALAGLLRIEREETDIHLKTERIRADEAVLARDDFFAMVSHDLRSLLGGIALSAAQIERLARTPERPIADAGRHASSIQRFTARMNRLIGDLIDVASIEAGKLAVEPVRYDATQLIRDAMDAFQAAAAAEQLTLECEVDPHPTLARFDHDRILQVLSNLVGNAIKFTPEGGRITIRVQPAADGVRFSVQDTGEGIPVDRLETVFDRFSQARRDDRRGLGLGLYIAKCIVEAHGGRIWAESAPGKGTTVTFTLPAAEASG